MSDQKQKINLTDLKKDLVEDLDQFLLDNDFTTETVKEEKKRALAELDKLIKQDLSYSQILHTIKSDLKTKVEDKIEKKETQQFTHRLEFKNGYRESTHVLDLKKTLEERAKPRTKNNFTKYKDSFESWSTRLKNKQIDQSDQNDLNFWQYPKLNFNLAFSKALIFALILAVILFPIRAVVLFGQINEDKGKILDFGQEGLLSLKSGVISALGKFLQKS